MDNLRNSDVQQRAQVFSDKSSRLQKYLGETKNLIHSLRLFSSSRYPVHYPINTFSPRLNVSLGSSENFYNLSTPKGFNSPASLSRANTFFQDSHDSEDNEDNTSTISGLDSLSVLKVDARLFKNNNSDLVSSLEGTSVSRLLEECLLNSEAHIDKLIYRVADNSSKILITGDLNAGKTTLINSLIRKQVLPVDQQPCTMLFCEVLESSKNGDREEIHGISDISKYNTNDPSTYTLVSHQDLEDTVFENKQMFQQLKVYLNESNGPYSSLLHNGTVDISFIDSPGLNRDSIKTTQLFARQEEIDVVVFVVNAENHFTLSGQEFLASAGKEKAHIFIVVNKFDAIRKKDKCRSMIMEQICELSPETYEMSKNLVHFISAKNVNSKDSVPQEFDSMERSLRWWTLEQRFKSKLAPAQRYILNVLGDLQFIAAENTAIALKSIREINDALRASTPRYERLLDQRILATNRSELIVDDSSSKVQEYSEEHLNTIVHNLEASAFNVNYSGIFSVWDYAEQVLVTMVNHIKHELYECVNFSKSIVGSSINELNKLDLERSKLEGGSMNDNLSIKPLSKITEEKDTYSDSLEQIEKIIGDLSTISISVTDFVDFNWEKLQISGSLFFSASSLFFYTKFANISNLIDFVNFSSRLSPRALGGSFFLVAGALGFGSVMYLFNNTDATVRGKLSKRIKQKMIKNKHISSNVRVLVTSTNRAIRPFAWQFQTNFQKMLEAEERKRADHLRSRQLSQEAQMFFDELRAKISTLSRNVRSISSDEYFK
ncbi:hypothetical protein BB560_001754 [Smittium megazygosporum]|uniref:Dynamin-type G domain-containing protein n=1 Tax=Smittium megazygosporum TaxID=133381 RepID=A0A2T9ZGQ3_9FUNG|nr:hypothetical protein BB560_001754 [Smittium megazygosporum]